jgi:4,5-dihydroxyphthalate decarboxylase
MADLSLTLACWDYDRTRPLLDGRVRPEGIDLNIQVMRPRVIFSRMLQHQEFDVSELSLSPTGSPGSSTPRRSWCSPSPSACLPT